MSKQTTFTKCFEQLCRTNQTEIKSTYANDFIAWCKIIGIEVQILSYTNKGTTKLFC